MKSIITIALLMMLVVPAFSPSAFRNESTVRLAPRMLSYQGILTDTLGNPITHPSDTMSFAIFDQGIAGNQLWSETQTSVNVKNGLFNVLLGSVVPIPDSVFTKGTNRWLELTVSGVALAPRTRIVSAGYAYSATYSDTAQYSRNAGTDNDWIISGGNLYSAVSGNVGIGTADPLATLDVFGTFCAGIEDTVKGPFGGILSGYGNRAGAAASDSFNAVGGGCLNTAAGYGSFIGGGFLNTTRGHGSFIGGGTDDSASGWYSVVAGGSYNKATNTNATVSGGYVNRASGEFAAVSGGSWNLAAGTCAFAAGGWSDTARGDYSSVLGGANNIADASCAIAGGWFNTTKALCGGALSGFGNLAGDSAIDTAAFIGGGWDNTATAKVAAVCGGHMNVATGTGSFIGGGSRDTASGWCAAIPGGAFNRAFGDYSFIGGGLQNLARDPHTTVAGGQQNQSLGKWTCVGGGRENIADDSLVFIGGGYNNIASAPSAVISGGFQNNIYGNGNYAVVGGGQDNEAWQPYCGVLSGYNNRAGQYVGDSADVVGGGLNNIAIGKYATVAGGYQDSALGIGATVPGGCNNTADGRNSFAAGQGAKAHGDNTFVWSDGSLPDTFVANGNNQFLVRATGYVGINTNTPWTTFSVAGSANLNQGVSSGPALYVNAAEAIWYNGTYFSWGFGGSANYFSDNVGIGITAPAYPLDVAGACHASSFPTSSDIRLKKDIKPLTNALEKIMKLRGVSFDWNETYEKLGRSTHHREIGVIAQDVEAVFPELVSKWGDEQYRGVDYGRLTAALIEAVKELKAENDDLRARIEVLEKR